MLIKYHVSPYPKEGPVTNGTLAETKHGEILLFLDGQWHSLIDSGPIEIDEELFVLDQVGVIHATE